MGQCGNPGIYVTVARSADAVFSFQVEGGGGAFNIEVTAGVSDQEVVEDRSGAGSYRNSAISFQNTEVNVPPGGQCNRSGVVGRVERLGKCAAGHGDIYAGAVSNKPTTRGYVGDLSLADVSIIRCDADGAGTTVRDNGC